MGQIGRKLGLHDLYVWCDKTSGLGIECSCYASLSRKLLCLHAGATSHMRPTYETYLCTADGLFRAL